MTQYTLLMLEISGIQPYIFGTNNLSVNVGASALVNDIGRTWIPAYLSGRHNIGNDGTIHSIAIEDETDLDAEAIYVGGGNALFIFRKKEHIEPFIRRLSARLLREAPDLRAVIQQVDFAWHDDILVNALEALRSNLAERKQVTSSNRPLAGTGVSATCVFTGQPASTQIRFGPPGTPLQLVSDTVATKRHYFETIARAYFDDLTKDIKLAEMKPVSDFGDFGEEGSSFIAVVHADGNRMGERIKNLGEQYLSADKNRTYANALRDFSIASKKAAMTALKESISLLIRQMHRDIDGNWCWQRRNLSEVEQERLPKALQNTDREGNLLLPFRPIVFGGDDVTFVCDGRLGLALAHYFLKVYGEQPLTNGEKAEKAVGRAGIAVVNTHYPFAQAYNLAENLAESAKTEGNGGALGSLDWHFGVNGVLDSLKTIRETSYTVSAGSLHFRPVRLKRKDGNDRQYWDTFYKLVTEFQIGDDWHNKRSRLKGLQTALRGGITETRAYLTNYGLGPLPQVDPTRPQFETDGWVGDECPYFDALEAMDFFIPLEEPE